MLTEYRVGEHTVYDIAIVLKAAATEQERVSVRVRTGLQDISNWRRIKDRFGDSQVEMEREGQMFNSTKIKVLNVDKYRDMEEYTLHITPRVTDEYGERRKIFFKERAYAKKLAGMSMDEIEVQWEFRRSLNKEMRIKASRKIWEEIECRLGDSARRPVHITLPFFREVNILKVKNVLRGDIRELAIRERWPAFLTEWHVRRVRVSMEARQSIKDIMSNVHTPWRPTACRCGELRKAMADRGCPALPEVNGHIFLVGRDYKGPWERVLHRTSSNIPTPTRWDMQRKWQEAFKQLPEGLTTSSKWKKRLQACVEHKKSGWGSPDFPTTRDVYSLRKMLKNFVIGPLDKNPGECSVCCPVIYEEAKAAAYAEEKGYAEVYPRRVHAANKKKHAEDLPGHVESLVEVQDTERGSQKDVVASWAYHYKRKDWKRFAPFDYKGGFNEPYVLFKAKHITNLDTRVEKWRTATRPIAPGTKHPMRRLLRLAGRAWYFMVKHYQGEHFAIQKTQDVPREMWQMHSALSRCLESGDTIQCEVKDIKGCYPNMPKTAIKTALRDIAEELGKLSVFRGFCAEEGAQAALPVEDTGRWTTRAQM